MKNNDEDKNPRKTWDLMIGITLVLIGSLRLYNRLKVEESFSLRAMFTLVFVIFGGYLIFRYFQNSEPKD